MDYAVELYFSEECTKKVLRFREVLQEAQIGGLDLAYDVPPHLTLGYFANSTLGEASALLDVFASSQQAFRVRLVGLGVFLVGQQAVLYLASSISTELVEAHERALDVFEPHTEPVGEYCLRGNLAPHITLADSLPFTNLSRVAEVVAAHKELAFPQYLDVERVALDVESRILYELPLLEQAAGTRPSSRVRRGFSLERFVVHD